MSAGADHLEVLAAVLRSARAALDGADLDPDLDFAPPPPPDGPLDPCDRVRAAALERELGELIARLAAAQRCVGEELAAVQRPRAERAAQSGAHYFDGYG